MISRETIPSHDGLLQHDGSIDAFGSRDFEEMSLGELMPGLTFNAIAYCLADQVSAKQVQIVRSLTAEAEIDVNELTWNLFDCDFAELSKKAAERLIAYLELAVVRSRHDVRLAG